MSYGYSYHKAPKKIHPEDQKLIDEVGPDYEKYKLLLQHARELGLIKQAGAFHKMLGADGEPNIQGAIKTLKYLSEHPTYAATLEQKIKHKLAKQAALPTKGVHMENLYLVQENVFGDYNNGDVYLMTHDLALATKEQQARGGEGNAGIRTLYPYDGSWVDEHVRDQKVLDVVNQATIGQQVIYQDLMQTHGKAVFASNSEFGLEVIFDDAILLIEFDDSVHTV